MPPPNCTAAEALEDRCDRGAVDRFARECAVEINDVEPFGARLLEALRLRGGIVAIDGGAVHIAFRQADDLAGLEVDGGEDDEGHIRSSPGGGGGSAKLVEG